MFEPFHDVVTNVAATIGKYEAELDRPVIGVMPAYFPLELIDAAGGYPVQLWGNNLPIEKSDAYLQPYCCSVARSLLELELRGIAQMVKAYAFTSLCDTLVNLREIYRGIFTKPTVELSIPVTQTVEARNDYLKSVVRSVTDGLENVTGRKITPETLQQASQRFGRSRALQRQFYRIRRENPGLIRNHDFYTVIKSAFFLPADIYNVMLENLLTDLAGLKEDDHNRPKLLLSGMVFDPIEVYKIFDDSGVWIVDDDFANGWRTIAKNDLKTENLARGVTEYLFNPAPCCCIYNPDHDRYTYLSKKVKETGADGVLFWYIKFCEPDAFDRPQLMQRLKQEGIAVAFIDLELTMTNYDQLQTRINAFCEILEATG